MRAPQQQLEVHSGTVCTAKAAAARTRAVVKNQALGRTGASDLRLSLSWIGKQSGERENGASDLYEHLGNLGIVGHSEGGGPGAGGGLWGATAGGHCKNCDCFSGCWDFSCSKWLKCVIFRPWYSPRCITKHNHLRWMKHRWSNNLFRCTDHFRKIYWKYTEKYWKILKNTKIYWKLMKTTKTTKTTTKY